MSSYGNELGHYGTCDRCEINYIMVPSAFKEEGPIPDTDEWEEGTRMSCLVCGKDVDMNDQDFVKRLVANA